MTTLLLIAAAVGGTVFFLSRQGSKNEEKREAASFDDAIADARRWTERLGGQVMNVSGTDTASTQAMADASERFTAANSALARAETVAQARLARESALEGMHYVAAAREIMGLPAGPELPPLEGQREAGKVTERRTVEVGEGQTLTASPYASADTPNYYPGGKVAGRPVPAGWYSRPWWADALTTGVWMMGYSMMFSSLFHGMSGVGYSAADAETGAWGGAEGAAGGDAGAGELGAGDSGAVDSGAVDSGAVDSGAVDAGAADAGAGEGGFFGGEGLFGGDGGGFFDGFDF
ncbi:hypothetical protein CPHO_03165 [Corynebacterium phocae]|uniref:DUF1542 domain-containing protein n=1 Tax=Corynebacterium phocae TaxID=161895 RepID=A0A1L7D1L5_9CORY|nr:hypothetical protein [Corynebacterium phocae]APT92056.1 hypothetical protein CPHO_03165 [Corynebacterium phocae]KAA8726439.1 DUF1542 domain-containing protein [Corynebacterium phocae]